MLVLEDAQLELEEKHECLELCLQRLSPIERELIRRYHEKDGEGKAKIVSRERLAQELGMTVSALRLKAFWLREKLRICMESCLNCNHHKSKCTHY